MIRVLVLDERLEFSLDRVEEKRKFLTSANEGYDKEVPVLLRSCKEGLLVISPPTPFYLLPFLDQPLLSPYSVLSRAHIQLLAHNPILKTITNYLTLYSLLYSTKEQGSLQLHKSEFRW